MFKEIIRTTIINTTKQFLTSEKLNVAKIVQMIDVAIYLFHDIDFIIEAVKEENARFLWSLDFKLKNNPGNYSHTDRKEHEQRRRIKQFIDSAKNHQIQKNRVIDMLVYKVPGFTASQAAYCVLMAANASQCMARIAAKVFQGSHYLHLHDGPSPKNIQNVLNERRKIINDVGVPLLEKFYQINNAVTEICGWLKSVKFGDSAYMSDNIFEKEGEDHNLMQAISVVEAVNIKNVQLAEALKRTYLQHLPQKPVWPFGLNMKDSSKKKGKKK